MNTSTKLFAAAFLIAISAIGANTAIAQYPGAAPAGQAPPPMSSGNRATQIAQARQANAALMHQYLWQSRVEIIKNGTVKDMRLEQVSYDPNGQLQHTTLNDQGGNKFYLPTPIGFLRRAVADHEKEEMEKYLTGLKGVLEQYTLPRTNLNYVSLAEATVASKQLSVQMQNYNYTHY